MFSSEANSRGFHLTNPGNQSTFKHVSVEGEFLKSKEFMGSEFFQNQNQNHHQSNGLARYRSAPSSFLAALMDSTTDNSSSGDESEALFSAFMDGPRDLNQKNPDNQMQYSMKQEEGVDSNIRPGKNGFPDGSGYENVVGSYPVGNASSGNGNRNCSSLVRQSSSPAGFFNGFGVMGEVGNYKVHTEASSSSGGLTNHMNFTSEPSSGSRFMPTIPETENNDRFAPDNRQLRNDTISANNDGREYEPAYRRDSWNESHFNSLKRNRDGDMKMFSNFSVSETPNGESRKKSSGLVSHMSLPNSSAEMAIVENFLQFQPETTTVPCQIRAKRGFATHPRSIAERMRRTRISEKMKKLQDLFPEMDKQTNTADMLDMAVVYIKDLQKEVKMLSDTKAKCVCSSKSQQTS